MARVRQFQHARWHHFIAVGVQKAHGHRNNLIILVGLPRRGWIFLCQVQHIPTRHTARLPIFGNLQARRSGLGIPKRKLRQITARGVFEHFQPVFNRCRLPIVAIKIQIQRAGIIGIAHQRLQHADHLGAFFVNGGGVEIVDLDVIVGPHRMRQRTAIFAKLPRAQAHHVFNPFHRMTAHVAAELLIAEHRQPLFQAQLKPIAAGDAVARPVVKILMRDDRLDAGIVIVRRGVRTGQNIAGVENVQTLVLHRAHIEVIDGHNVENVQVVFTPVSRLIPLHRPDQRIHRIGATGLITRPHPNVQINRAARCGGETRRMRHQIARHHRKQIGRFGPWIIPLRPSCPLPHRIAI